MKTYVGNIYLELPGAWDDDSTFLYREPGADIEIRIEKFPVGPPATPDSLIEKIEERIKMLGTLASPTRGKAEVTGREARTLSVTCKREGDKEVSLMEVLVFKTSDTSAVSITATAPSKQQMALNSAWRSVLSKTKLIEVVDPAAKH